MRAALWKLARLVVTLYFCFSLLFPILSFSQQLNWQDAIPQIAARYGHDPALIRAIIRVESWDDPNAVSNRGARGLMQIMQDTWNDVITWIMQPPPHWGWDDAFDPIKNIEVGCAYLAWLRKELEKDKDKWRQPWPQIGLAAYNGGLGNVRQYNFDIPPFDETLKYVSRVMELYQRTLALQEAVAQGFVELESKGEYFGDGVTFISTGRNFQDIIVKIRKGDVFLSKNPDRQNLVAIKDQVIFISLGQRLREEGIWIACLDSNKAPPHWGDKFDITLNLRDWPYRSALGLLNLLELEEYITQSDIWNITDRGDFPKLSNPNSAWPKTGFTQPPELSEISPRDLDGDGITDEYDFCPHEPGPLWNNGCPVIQLGEKSIEEALDFNRNYLMDDNEILQAINYWISGEPVPETGGKIIDDTKILELMDMWIKGEPRPPSISEAKVKGTRLVVEVLPKLVRGPSGVRFKVEGSGIAETKIQIFTLAGHLVYDSYFTPGDIFEWRPQTKEGQPLANGVYLYVVRVRGFDGREYVSAVRKLVIVR